MDYIKGRLKILNDLEYFKPRGLLYYSSTGLECSLQEALVNLDTIIPTLDSLKIPFNLVKDGITFTFNTLSPTALKGKYEAFIYPASYGKLSHIYCVGSTEDPTSGGMLHIDLLSTWKVELIKYSGLEYYFYIQDRPVKDNNVSYNFMFELGGK